MAFPLSLADHKITNQGFLFLAAPYCFHEVRQSTMPFPAWIEDSLPIKGVRDRVRKKLERLGDNPAEENRKVFFQDIFGLLDTNICINEFIREAEDIVPEDMGHAGAWVAVHGFSSAGISMATTTTRSGRT